MKKVFLVITAVLAMNVNIAFSQENESVIDNLRKHEVKINGLLLASSTTLDVTYEYVGNTSYGFGASVLVNAFDREFPRERFAVTPFYRAYFFSKKDYGANGIFVEGFLKMASIKKGHNYDGNKIEPKNAFESAIGISIGKKWVNRNGFVLEIFGGVGRVLNEGNSNVGVLGRGGITIGKRF